MDEIIKRAFHDGELSLQKRFDVPPNPKTVARVYLDKIIEAAIPFIESQSTIILSSLDADENIWASVLVGGSGFLKVTHEKELHINLNTLVSDPNDIFLENILHQPKAGILIIDTVQRIRFRINGDVTLHENKLNIHVKESYPNCPKYIQKRQLNVNNSSLTSKREMTTGSVLTQSFKNWITSADTFFLGSMNPTTFMDASHRGGPTGFIQILEDDTLKIPDYVGNNLFNTLGNFFNHPKAGLTFVNFETGRTLQLTGSTNLLFDQHSVEDEKITTGTGRYWLFKPQVWRLIENNSSISWEFVDFSPFNPNL